MTQGSKKKVVNENVFFQNIRINELDQDGLRDVINIISNCLKQGKRSRKYIQEQIILLSRNHYRIITEEITKIIQCFDDLGEIEQVLNEMSKIQGQKTKSLRLAENLRGSINTGKGVKIVGYTSAVVQQYNNLSDEFNRYKQDSENQEAELNGYLDELKEIQNRDKHITQNEKFAITNKIEVAKAKQKITENKIKISKEQAQVFFTAIQAQIVKDEKQEETAINECEGDVENGFSNYLEQIKEVNSDNESE